MEHAFDRRHFLVAGASLAAAAIATTAEAATGGQMTIHILDVYSGSPAHGMRVDLLLQDGAVFKPLKAMTTGPDGRPPGGPVLKDETLKTGRYQAALHVGEYYRKIGAAVPAGYDTRLILEFVVYDAAQPHHLPFQITPWTLSSSVLPG
jgi:5-hydroxyisourate hydrolase